MDILIDAFVSFFAMYLIISHLSARSLRRLVGYKGYVDAVLHVSVIYMFFATSTEGLLQAEAAAIMFSLWLRAYRWASGFERYNVAERRWMRFNGRFT
jgi:hypothetical protein